MNCLEFRRKLHQDPRCDDSAFLAHAQECALCQREFQRAQQFESSLREALNIEPPADLAARILYAQRAEAADHPAPKQRGWTVPAALAAGLMSLVIGATLFFGAWRDQAADGATELEATVLHHIQDELPHLHQVRDVTPDALNSLISGLGGELKAPLRKVNFAGKCQMRKYPGAHLVLVGEKGPVTVLIMPGERIAATHRFSSERFTGELIPTRYGSFAVVGEKGENTDAIAAVIAEDIAWPG